MTLKQSQRLLARQAGKVSLQSLDKVFLGQKVNPRLVETILLNNTNGNVLDKVRDYFVERVGAGDKRALNVLLRASDESLNKNRESRVRVISGLGNLAQKGELGLLPSLLRAVGDSDASVRLHAVVGLWILAKKGEAGVLPGLLKAAGDFDAGVRWNSGVGLQHFARLGNKQAQKKLTQLGKKW